MKQRVASIWAALWSALDPSKSLGLVAGLTLTVAASLAAALLRMPFEPQLNGAVPFATYFPAVLIVGLLAGWRFSALALLLSILLTVWLTDDIRAPWPVSILIFVLSGGMLAAIAEGVRSIARDRRRFEAEQQLLLSELSHRSKNTLAVVRALARLTAHGSGSVADFEQRFAQRLNALSEGYTLFLQCETGVGELHELIPRALSVFELEAGGRLQLRPGQRALIKRRVALPLTLALHELATNALKYGALTNPEGRVDVTWRTAEDTVELTWREHGGPPAAPPEQKGSGSRLIAAAVGADPKGRVEHAFTPEGVWARFVFSAEPLEPLTGTAPASPLPGPAASAETCAAAPESPE